MVEAVALSLVFLIVAIGTIVATVCPSIVRIVKYLCMLRIASCL